MRSVEPQAKTLTRSRALLISLLLISGASGADTFSVTRSDDPIPDGCQIIDCSLREAVLAANAAPGADTIALQGVTYELSQAGVDDFSFVGDLDITESLTIEGLPGFNPPLTTVDANGIDRVFQVLSGASLTLQSINVRGGGNVSQGGGIRASGGLVLRNTYVQSNDSSNAGGGIYSPTSSSLRIEQNSSIHGNSSNTAGGIFKGPGEFVVRDSRVGNNLVSATGTGAGIYVSNSTSLVATNALIDFNGGGLKGGGIYALNSELTLIATTILNNASDSGGGLYLQSTGSVAQIINSVVQDNFANGEGGGAYAEGEIHLTNSTFSGNSAADGGAVYLTVEGAMSTEHATIAGNFGSGDVLFIEDGFTRVSAVTWLNSILAGDCMRNGANVTSLGGNLETTTDTCGLGAGANDQVFVGILQIGLLALDDYGGPTFTHAITDLSAAKNNAVCPDSCLEVDQRFFTRGPDPVDSGAFENGPIFSDSFETLGIPGS